MKIREKYTCPLELVHDMVKGKWKPIIIFQLRDGKCSFSELQHSIIGISPKMLLEQLAELKHDRWKICVCGQRNLSVKSVGIGREYRG